VPNNSIDDIEGSRQYALSRGHDRPREARHVFDGVLGLAWGSVALGAFTLAIDQISFEP
jgi:hypothetical protein